MTHYRTIIIDTSRATITFFHPGASQVFRRHDPIPRELAMQAAALGWEGAWNKARTLIILRRVAAGEVAA